MYDHIGLRVKDISASVRFYEAALVGLGYALLSRDDASVGFGPRQGAAFWLYPAAKHSDAVVHIAFTATDRHAVDRFHAAGLKAGGRDHGLPALRPDYGSNYYAAFLLDPDGNNVEAVCL